MAPGSFPDVKFETDSESTEHEKRQPQPQMGVYALAKVMHGSSGMTMVKVDFTPFCVNSSPPVLIMRSAISEEETRLAMESLFVDDLIIVRPRTDHEANLKLSPVKVFLISCSS